MCVSKENETMFSRNFACMKCEGSVEVLQGKRVWRVL